MDNIGLKNGVEENVEMAYYDAGHMMYTHKKSLSRLSADLRKFVKRAS